MKIHVEKGLYYRHEPTSGRSPLVVDVSRSGREYPPDMRSPLPFTTLHDNVSMYLDEIWESAPQVGGVMLYALFPHMYIDANRNELDQDAELIDGTWPVPLKPDIARNGLGLLKAKSRYGEPVQERKFTVAEITERLERCHRPYHAELDRIIKETHAAFGVVNHISCHCMSAVGAPTHPDAGQERKDFCIGNLCSDGFVTSTDDYIDFIIGTIESMGFTCAKNSPYGGAELNHRHAAPDKGINSVLVEINKKRFMDVKTFRKAEGFNEIKAAADELLRAISEYRA